MTQKAIDIALRLRGEAYRFANYLAKTRGNDPEDAVQEAFLRTLQLEESGKYDPGRNFEKLFITIVRQSSIRQNYHKRKTNVLFTDDFSGISSTVNSPLDELIGVEDADNKWSYIDSLRKDLSEEDKEILYLRMQGLSCADIAEAIGKSSTFVRNFYSRFRARLRRLSNLT